MTGWRTARLGDVCSKITDGTHHSPSNGPTGDFKYITAKNIKPYGLDLNNLTYIDAATHAEIYSRCDVRRDDILYVKDGATTGRVALNTLDEPFSLLSSVGVFRPGPSVRPRYLLYVLQERSVKDRMLADVAGVAITRLTLKKLNNATIPLAPLELQDALVAEIEKQFSRLDEAVANLQRVKANLNRYTAAVLTAATDGTLGTVGGAALEPFERRIDGAGAGEQALTPLPASWCWSTAGAAIDAFEAGASFKCVERPPEAGEVGVLKVSALTWGAYDEQESKTCMDPSRVNLRYVVKPGDFLFSRANTIELVGACVIVGTVTKQLMLSDKTLRLRINPSVSPAWLQCCLRSKFGRAEIERLATGNQESMRNIG